MASLVLAAALAGTSPAGAKCVTVQYEASVRVLERGTDQPIGGVTVLFFVPGEDQALAPAVLTDSHGDARASLAFDTYSGWFLTDRCRARLTDLQVIASPLDRSAERFDFHHLEGRSAPGDDDRFALGVLTLRLFPPTVEP